MIAMFPADEAAPAVNRAEAVVTPMDAVCAVVLACQMAYGPVEAKRVFALSGLRVPVEVAP